MRLFIIGAGALALLLVAAHDLFAKEGQTLPNTAPELTVKARDGSSHRLRFRTLGGTTGLPFAYFATSTDTGLRFQEGEQLTIDGNQYRWTSARELARKFPEIRSTLAGPAAFDGGAFIPV